MPAVATELLDLTGRWARGARPAAHGLRARHRGCARAAAAAPGPTRRSSSSRGHGRASASAPVEVWGAARRLERQPPHARRAQPLTGERLLGGGELLAARRGAAGPRRVLHHAVGLRVVRRRARRARRPLPRLAARAAAAPAHAAAGHAQHLGGRLLRPRPRPAARPRRRRAPRSASSGSCSTTAGSAAGATTRRASATGTSTADVWPDGLHPLVDHVHGLGHAVRPLGRAGDGQPRLRPGPRAPRLDPARAGAAAA